MQQVTATASESLTTRVEELLCNAIARGADGDELLEAVSTATGCAVRVLVGAPSRTSELTDRSRILVPMTAGAENVGFLEVTRRGPRCAPDVVDALRAGASILAVETVKRRIVLETTWHLEADLLDSLIEAGADLTERLIERARRFGADLSIPWRVGALACTDGRALPKPVEQAARRRASAAEMSLACVRSSVLVVGVAETSDDAMETKLADLMRVGRGLGATLQAGVSSPCVDFDAGMRQAEAALRLAGRGERASIVHHEQLGHLRFLLDARDTTGMTALVLEQLGRLADHDQTRDSEFMSTLKAFLEEGGNKPRTAGRCHVHISTLKYRLGRIAALLDRNLGDVQVRFELLLAFQVLEILCAVGSDPLTRRTLRIA